MFSLIKLSARIGNGELPKPTLSAVFLLLHHWFQHLNYKVRYLNDHVLHHFLDAQMDQWLHDVQLVFQMHRQRWLHKV